MGKYIGGAKFSRAFKLCFIKIKFDTHDNIGSGPISLPAEEMHTSGTWLTFDVPEDWEKSDLTDAMTSAAYVIQSLVPLFIKCDRNDIHVVPQVKAIHMERPTFFIYDSYPGGIGLSENIYSRWKELLMLAADHVSECPCEHGCPVCIGAQEAGQKNNKHRAHSLLLELAK